MIRLSKRALFAAVLLLAAGIWLGCGDDDGDDGIVDPDNSNPVITAVTADPDTIPLYELTIITVDAYDPDGDSLEYAWHITTGELEPIAADGNTYIVKSCCEIEDTTVSLVLAVVTDGRGGEARDTASVCILP